MKDHDGIPGLTVKDARRIQTALSESLEAANQVGFAGLLLHQQWVTEQRMKADRKLSNQLKRATWALAISTIVLVIVTFIRH